MAGISSKAFKGVDYAINKKGYNGNELQNREFSDGSGLEIYDFNARTYDAQIGRFLQTDPLIEEDQESLTPYQFGLDNPVLHNDPDGKCPLCLIPLIIEAIEAGAEATVIVGSADLAAKGTAQLIKNPPAVGETQHVTNNSFAWDPTYVDNYLRRTPVNEPQPGKVKLILPPDTQKPVNTANANSTDKKTGSIYKVPGKDTKSGKPYIGRHNKPNPAKTRRGNDGRNRKNAEVIDKYDPSNTNEGRAKEQRAIDDHGGVDNLDNKRNEVKKTKKDNNGNQ